MKLGPRVCAVDRQKLGDELLSLERRAGRPRRPPFRIPADLAAQKEAES